MLPDIFILPCSLSSVTFPHIPAAVHLRLLIRGISAFGFTSSRPIPFTTWSTSANQSASRLVSIYREQDDTFGNIADELNGEGYLVRNGKPFRKGMVHYLFVKGLISEGPAVVLPFLLLV